MKHADLHMHTCYSHGCNSPWEMHVAAERRGLGLIGFSEHSPRPEGYDYTHEYRQQLASHFPHYIRDVMRLKEIVQPGGCRVLLGLEMDWLSGEEDFIRRMCAAQDYDYLIGSVHFLGKWGFDDVPAPWERADEAQRFAWYERYFMIWKEMLQSGLFQIAAHPDLVKIFSRDSFREWLRMDSSLKLVEAGLRALRDAGMAMEVSSAGLRKPCGEIYPAPAIMKLAAANGVMISLASDAHNVRDVGADFDRLIEYARSFGFDRQTFFERGAVRHIPF